MQLAENGIFEQGAFTNLRQDAGQAVVVKVHLLAEGGSPVWVVCIGRQAADDVGFLQKLQVLQTGWGAKSQ
ncbi:hypothetical protein [Candidatus Amarolinea dominans]|uniref:hypothetical protein n=1 Tax=Candidatus Amarolinea dominans TaxID=3140696 RepID=UPI0031CCB37A